MPMLPRLFLAFVLFFASFVVYGPVYGDEGGRKVTRFEYDGLGRTVGTLTFDDRNGTRHLVSESTREYDVLHNVVREVSHRVTFDQDGDGVSEPAISTYETIEARTGYEDPNWPQKPTITNNPRFSHLSEAEQRRRAGQVWYDKETGLPQLAINSEAYCTDVQSSNAALLETSEVFSVDRGEQTVLCSNNELSR